MARPTALVTGASAGIGRAIAEQLAARDHDLVLVARRRDRLEALAQTLQQRHGVRVRVEAVDLTAPDACAALCERLAADGVVVDLLVNNAGFGTSGPFVAQDLDRELAQIRLNVLALVELSHRFGRAMAERGRGAILNVASTAGMQPGPGMAVYYATKAFVLSFSEAIAVELAPAGVRVTVHCPGATATEFGDVSGNAASRLFRMRVARADQVARDALRALDRGKVVRIEGWINRLGAFLVRLAPRAIVRRVTAWLNAR